MCGCFQFVVQFGIPLQTEVIETFHQYNKEDNERPQQTNPFMGGVTGESNMQDLNSDTVFEDNSLQLGASDDDEG